MSIGSPDDKNWPLGCFRQPLAFENHFTQLEMFNNQLNRNNRVLPFLDVRLQLIRETNAHYVHDLMQNTHNAITNTLIFHPSRKLCKCQ